MNSRERVMATIKGESKDRVPVAPLLSLYGAKLIDCKLKDYYCDYKKYIHGQEEIIKEFDPDFIFGPFGLAKEAQAFGAKIKYYDDQAPNILKPPFLKTEDFKFDKIDFQKSRQHQYMIKSVKGLVEKFGDKKMIGGIIAGPAEIPTFLFGLDKWIEMLLFDLERAKKILEFTENYFLRLVEELKKVGADFVGIPLVFTNPRIITKKLLIETIIPFLNDTFLKSKLPVVIHHGGNSFSKYEGVFKDMENLLGVIPGAGDDLNEIRKIFGKKILVVGKIDGPTLDKVSPENIKKIANMILRERREDKKFILGTSGADISYYSSKEQIKALINAVKGDYL